ncbi:hypothetical protein [Streptomyces sp. NBC_01429]|uniref:hypothetical protein n=1 Tax=Streptomyces sp. NBC_01429 TaxID=2903862 RepID=UPI002E28E960|nr:hypothetical protein [Streptomyces sp. NBC_01429]
MATSVEPRTTDETATRKPPPGPLPVAITSRPIADDEFRVTKEIGTFSESLGCSCQADDDQPY